MIDFDFNTYCCGCTACANSCPVGAIVMNPNEEGFMMPNVDKNVCIDCGRCDKVCPYLNSGANKEDITLDSFREKKQYLYFSESERRKESASGGFVYDAMATCLDEGGVVCGCVWDNDMRAVHLVSDKREDLYRMQSSKYVQSDMGGCYKEIKDALNKGRNVVFCGTPCQTAGLRNFIGKNKNVDNLTSICLICHGVPSPGVWKRWVGVTESKYQGSLVDVNMRDKSYKGYSTSYVRYKFLEKKGRLRDPHTSQRSRYVGMPTFLADYYIFLFSDNLYLRNSCYNCRYKAEHNGADIIVGDFYASIKEAGKYGCSCLIPMTEKGEACIAELKGFSRQSSFEEVCQGNNMLWKSVGLHPRREEFFERYKSGESDERLFSDFLKMKFKIKKVLNKLGLFNLARKLIK